MELRWQSFFFVFCFFQVNEMITWWVKTWFSPCRHNFNVTAVNLVIMMHKLHQINVGAFYQITSAVVSICPADEIFSCFLTGAERTCDLVAFFFYLLNCRLNKNCRPWKYENVTKAKHFCSLFWKMVRWDDFKHVHFKRRNARQLTLFFFFLPVQEQSVTHHSLIWNFPWLMKSFFFFLSGHWSVRCFHTGDHFRGLQWCVSLPSVTSSAFFPLSVLNSFPPCHPAKVLPLPVSDW